MVESFVQGLCADYDIRKDVYSNILISLTEAVNNAIIHGNNEDENKFVQVESRIQLPYLSVRVSDEGLGFNPNSLPDPTVDENICRIGGRGVFLIRQLSDNVRFIDNGRTVEMSFKVV